MQPEDLLSRARADHLAFGDLTSGHHRELEVHCYRMLGSRQDAEDAPAGDPCSGMAGPARLRGTSVAAHLALPAPPTAASTHADERAAARPRRGTCPALRSSTRAAARSRLAEPYPDRLLPARLPRSGPKHGYEQLESVTLAFVTAMPPRQLAVVVLRDAPGSPPATLTCSTPRSTP